jgi:hypothetical protein
MRWNSRFKFVDVCSRSPRGMAEAPLRRPILGPLSLLTLLALGCRAPDAPSAAAIPLDGGGSLHAAVDGAGLRLNIAEDVLTVRTVGWGRSSGERSDLAPGHLSLAACAPWSVEASCGPTARTELLPSQLVEWTQGTLLGPQQGWEVTAPPPGAGALVLALAVEGDLSSLRVSPRVVTMRTAAGAAIRVDHLAAWDATGRDLQARFVAEVGGFGVRVEDEGAVYPLHIDPVYSSTITEVSGSGRGWFYFGNEVAGVGDTDGDGFGDVAISSHNDNEAWVYNGASGGLDTSGATDLAAPSSASDVRFGRHVFGADVNGDGYDDVIVLEYRKYERANVYVGSAAGVSTAASTTLTLRGMPYSGALLGDTNGDGYDDVAFALCDEGAIEVAYGSALGLSSASSSFLEVLGGTGGCDVDATGDMNGDGYADLVAGQEDGGSGDGLIVLVTSGGMSAGFDDGDTTELEADTKNQTMFGATVAGLGDINGDGYPDIAVGGERAGDYVGRVDLYLGSGSGIGSSPAMTYTGAATSDAFGKALAGAGDLEADGLGELLIGAYGLGEVTVVRGSADVTTAPTTTLSGSYRFGSSVAGAGDVNGDGYHDIIIGAPGSGSKSGPSAFYVYYGCPDGDLDGWCTSEDCDDGDSAVYPGAAEAVADGIDSDCDGEEECYTNDDNDGHRADTLVRSADGDCDDTGEALASVPSGDCDDTRSDVWPGAPEIPGDEVDQDCDGGEICLQDNDGDGSGTLVEVISEDADCMDSGEAPAADALDCDDADPAVSPSAVEVPGDGVDQDCDGLERCYVDSDGDGYRTEETTIGVSLACDSVGEADASIPNGDCEDADAAIHPGAAEIPGDEVDQDCDGRELCFVDGDSDGYTTVASVSSNGSDCSGAGQYTDDQPSGDCNDINPAVNPGAVEAVNDGVDNNCDGIELCYFDSDGDGFPSTDTVASDDLDCTDPGEAFGDTEGPKLFDCDDNNPNRNPDEDETLDDGIDQDCVGGDTCYRDADDDGHRPYTDVIIVSDDLDCTDPNEAETTDPKDDCDDELPNSPYAFQEEGDTGKPDDCDTSIKGRSCDNCTTTGQPNTPEGLLPLAALAFFNSQRRRAEPQLLNSAV